MRIRRACRLLAEDGRSIAAVALAAGFANLSTFNLRFRRVTGMTPSAWRRRVAAG